MARPAEKARSMLNKWVALREQQEGGGGGGVGGRSRRSNRRPHLASECEHLADAERFRGQIVREISEGIAKIQNPALGEHQVREINDEINHRMREKWHWNRRIKELGGLDYNAIERQRKMEEGNSAAGGGRYQYFGAAKDLPGVKEHLAEEEAKRQKKSVKDLYRTNITPDYYGWRDEEDGVLLELETLASKQSAQLYNKRRRTGQAKVDQEEESAADQDYLAVSSPEDIQKALLEYKKKAFMKKYNI